MTVDPANATDPLLEAVLNLSRFHREHEKRYAEAEKEAKARELERLQAELGVVCYNAPGSRRKLRIVA